MPTSVGGTCGFSTSAVTRAFPSSVATAKRFKSFYPAEVLAEQRIAVVGFEIIHHVLKREGEEVI